MDKLLPIKFMEKRKRDEQLTEAGGGGDMPKWVLQGDELTRHSQQLASGVAQVSAEFKKHKTEEHALPMVMATTITEEALAKSHRGAVVDLLNSDKNPNVIGVESVDTVESGQEDGNRKEERRLLSIVTTEELLSNIDRALKDTAGSAKLISSISGMELFEAKNGDYNPDNKAYRVRLIDYQDRNRNLLAQELFKNQCESKGILIERQTRYSSDMNIYRISIDSIEDMETVRCFEGVFSIEEAVPIRASLDMFDEDFLPAVKTPNPDESYPVIGVLDSGIEKNRFLSPWLLKEKEVYYEDALQDRSHGSMVASVLEYSDELNGTDYAAADGVMMLEAVIAPDLKKENVYPEDLIDNVRDAVERHPEIKVWTMSAGTTEQCETGSFSEYGMAFDNIADENKVLIIKSAGNCSAFMKGMPNQRIAKMADSVRSLVVGSIAGEKGTYDMSEIDAPSPFTRRGPGPAYIIKPDLVAYGGNAGVLPNGNLTTTGVKAISASGSATRAAGTSFSTPWVARIATELNYLLDGDFDPLLIKAMMVHNAEYPSGWNMTMDNKKKFMGFGMPVGTRDILYNSENEITLVLRDSLQKGTFINILDFPFSDSLVGEDGFYHGQVVLTVISSPLLRTSEGPEYCQSDIKVAFGTMDGIKERDTTKRTIRNEYGADQAKNIMNDSLYSSKYFDVLKGEEDNTFARERTLLRLGDKFYPVKKYAVNFDDMTDGNKRKYLSGSRKWYMKVETLFRDAVEREAKETGEILEQEFCILLTVRDQSGKAPVYNEITQQLQEKGFFYSNVQLKNEVREHVRIEEENNG